MEKKHITELLPEYLDRSLDKSQNLMVEVHLSSCTVCAKEQDDLKTLLIAFENEPSINPSDNLRTNFLEQLVLEKQNDSKVVSIESKAIQRKNNWTSNLLKIAASIVFIVTAYTLGRYSQQGPIITEVVETNKNQQNTAQLTVLALIENTSASKRIQAVNHMNEIQNPDKEILKALVDRMLNDENTNVRLTAFEALKKFTASEIVKTSLIKALKTENNPAIQIGIIQTLVKIQEKKAIAPMQQLLEQKNTQPFIKEQLKLLIPSII